jgi:hypothetical protein
MLKRTTDRPENSDLDSDEREQRPKRIKRENIDPEEAQGANIEKRFSLTAADLPPSAKDDVERDPKVFKKNLLYLMECHGQKMKSAIFAKGANVREDWLRQLTSRGLAQRRRGNEAPLDRLRKFFNLDFVDDLWLEDLIDSLKQTKDREARIQPYLRSKYWPSVEKFLALLQSNEYGFLEQLVNKLHEQETASAGRGDHNKAEKASARDLDEYRRSRSTGRG